MGQQATKIYNRQECGTKNRTEKQLIQQIFKLSVIKVR